MAFATIQKPELLAPVGSEEALLAAVRCGADAVYLGAGCFHARQHATPFDSGALADTVAYCHARGVQVHLTLNTLVRENEFFAALAEAERAAALGVDALIVQDRGLAAAIRDASPTLPLHASTQLSCHTPAGVRQLKAEGFSRVVLAREMTENEIAACCREDCEIEAFVHGALCMSVSGQCFLSALLGGRSGNRGRCAQPCRLPFAVEGTRRSADERALSLKDLSLFEHVQALSSIGVRSLKIEGRMKRPEYVAAAVSVCRAALDGRPIDARLLEDLQSVFSRSGFTDGYFRSQRTIAMFGSRTKDDVLAAPKAQKRLSQLYLRERAAVPLSMTLTMTTHKPLTLTAGDADGHTVSVAGEPPRVSDSPLGQDRLEAALQKCGGTPFYVTKTTLCRENGTDVPLSALNALRREALDKLLALREATVSHPFAIKPMKEATPVACPSVPAMVVRLSDVSQWSKALAAQSDLVVLPLSTPPRSLREVVPHGAVAVEIPRGLFGSEAVLQQALFAAKEAGAVAAVCHNIGAAPLCREAGLAALGGFGLHTFNRRTLEAHRQLGLCAATASFELSFAQMAFVKEAPLPVGAMMYGRLPLMLLRNCPAKVRLSCRDCRQDRVLVDRKGARFLLQCQNGCADLLNTVPLYLADKAASSPPLAFWTLYMTDETADEAARVVRTFAAAAAGRETPTAQEACPRGFTRGLAFKGVE